jgi:iron-sulfur cluster assembly accessory protein
MSNVEAFSPTPAATSLHAVPETPSPVKLTEKAAEMVRKAMEQENMKEHGLRVGVIGGGCSGLQYLLDFAPRPTPEDFVGEQFGIPVFVDQFSAGHLHGTTIDYVDGLNGSGFKFENPNIQRSCGCGSSFQT